MESHLLGRVRVWPMPFGITQPLVGLELEPLVLAEAKWETALEHLQTGPQTTRGS